jgi:hypothetical protein
MATLWVGRSSGAREMGDLKAALEDALSGQGQTSEPGIGKTRTAATKKKVHRPSGPGSSLFALMSSSETRSNSDPKWAWVQPALLRMNFTEPTSPPCSCCSSWPGSWKRAASWGGVLPGYRVVPPAPPVGYSSLTITAAHDGENWKR